MGPFPDCGLWEGLILGRGFIAEQGLLRDKKRCRRHPSVAEIRRVVIDIILAFSNTSDLVQHHCQIIDMLFPYQLLHCCCIFYPFYLYCEYVGQCMTIKL